MRRCKIFGFMGIQAWCSDLQTIGQIINIHYIRDERGRIRYVLFSTG